MSSSYPKLYKILLVAWEIFNALRKGNVLKCMGISCSYHGWGEVAEDSVGL